MSDTSQEENVWPPPPERVHLAPGTTLARLYLIGKAADTLVGFLIGGCWNIGLLLGLEVGSQFLWERFTHRHTHLVFYPAWRVFAEWIVIGLINTAVTPIIRRFSYLCRAFSMSFWLMTALIAYQVLFPTS